MSLSLDLLRPLDLLALRLELRNLRLDTSGAKGPRLVLEQPARPAFVIVNFPPQAIAERAYFEAAANVKSDPTFNTPPPSPLPSGDDPLDPPGSVPVRIAGASRLVFRLPANLTEIPYTMESLLDWSTWELVVSPTALAQPKPPPLPPPGPQETAIELPYRLILSPGSGVAWVHARRPATHRGRTELWHTRLARVRSVRTKAGTQRMLQEAGASDPIPLRAIWSPDFRDHMPLPDPGDASPFPMAMSRNDRAQIVILTSGAVGYYVPTVGGGAVDYVPQPVRASRVFLSTLGGWLSSRGDWPTPPSYRTRDGGTESLDLTEWCHLATQGRDHYVRIVYAGYLYPFGHRASLVKVTERKFVPPDGVVASPTAYLKQHMYIVVREPEKTYDPVSYTHAGREMPLRRKIRILTHVTPDIDKPTPLPGSSALTSFWVNVGGSGYPFHLTAEDPAGTTINFLARLIFVSDSESNLTLVKGQYQGSGTERLCAVRGQKVAYADPSAGDTVLRTTELFFDTQLLYPGSPFPTTPFLPTLDSATISVPVIEELLGTFSPISIQLYAPYLSGGLDANAGVFAQIVGTPPGVSFSADKAGGFATPAMAMTALSARKGLVAGKADDAAAGRIDPAAFFDNTTAKLFGTIPLTELIPVDKITKVAPAGPNAPEIRTLAKPNPKSPKSVVTKVHWAPQLTDYSAGPVSINFNSDGNHSALTLDARIERNLSGGPPSSDIEGALSNFVISLFGVIGLRIAAITFSSKNGSKTNVVAKLAAKNPITFIGPLSFVQTLADILPPGIFGGEGPSIDLAPTEVRVSYTLGLPPITTGVFSFEHIAITTGLDLPYLDGKPAFEFAFASRSKPFLVTVEIFGGGGFVHVVLDADGVKMVEGSIEFGGNFSLDLGVASGAVHAMAGIYFQLKGTSSDLTGFVDIGGEVSVLAIISISLDMNLSLSWEHTPHQDTIEGRATLTVAVHVLFFSASVSLSVEKSFSVGGGDPRVDQLLTAQQWSDYAGAFA
jgi:hypothetical protein